MQRHTYRRSLCPTPLLPFFVGVALVALALWKKPSFAAAVDTITMEEDVDWRHYPVRSQDEAAVIEWGHSAIISALDAAVAHFGPQTTQAALLEVETKPILADPVDGVWKDQREWLHKQQEQATNEGDKPPSRLLNNADKIHGNVAVMTDFAIQQRINRTIDDDTGGDNSAFVTTGLDLALLAQASGAAALLIVHVDEGHPDDIYRLPIPEGREAEAATIDIPVVVISLSSATVLTTATVKEDTKVEDIVNDGMPERIRLYAGGDRPFFEDVEAMDPTVYIIHNLLTGAECDTLIQQAAGKFTRVSKADELQLTVNFQNFVSVDRVMLWQGVMKGPGDKAIDERIEQVTGFPVLHYSDWIIDRLSHGSHWMPHYDVLPGNEAPLATITVFLSNVPSGAGGGIVYPSTTTEPIQIHPVKGLAIVHHNTNEKHEFDERSIHGMFPINSDDPDTVLYVARKYILPNPVSNARRVGLSVIAYPWGGKLPTLLVSLHDWSTTQFGVHTGGMYFDKMVMFMPVLMLLILLPFIVQLVHQQMKAAGVLPSRTAAATAGTTATAMPISNKGSKKKN